eukprot:TRINITY_DN1002_c0_g1_i1.p2 TRINITY_DN1002_c0_g1~~TRINITY_DN1002_c0_g1_i1.p2  ORF type:complete len:308 (-),score=21.73 TRINITY_DN1002_c0_g1_i1:507-1430(-)
MGGCLTKAKEQEGRVQKDDKQLKENTYPQAREVGLSYSSQSSTQPALTESVVHSMDHSGTPVTGSTRRPSSVTNSHLEMIHEGRQESFHSAVSHGSFVSAVSQLSEASQQSYLKKKHSIGKDGHVALHEASVLADSIPNDELKPFWQPMSLAQREGLEKVGSYRALTTHGFSIIGQKVQIQHENKQTQVVGTDSTLPQVNIDTSVQGSSVQESIVFRIGEAVKDLTCIKRVTKGVMQFTTTELMGDFEPGEYKYDFPKSVIPKGPFSRGQYHIVTTFIDTHGDELFSCVGNFKVIKNVASNGVSEVP